MGPLTTRTAKGRRGADRLVDAATVVLARDGFGAASIGRITEEAGVPKRMVAYYFGSREALLAEVVVGIGHRLAARLEEDIVASADGETLVAHGVDLLWATTVAEPEAVRAYFALVSGRWEGEAQEAIAALKDRYRELALQVLTARQGTRPLRSGEADAVVRLGFALLRGLALEWIDDPDSPALPAMVEAAKRMLSAELAP